MTPAIMEALKGLFQGAFLEPAETIEAMQGDGSSRRLWRLKSPRRSAVGAFGPDRRENRAFLGFSRSFRAAGLSVPEIYAEDAERGLYLEEDLGETTLFEFLARNRGPRGLSEKALRLYRKAVETLPRFQIAGGSALDYGLCYPRASFDKQSMMWDLNYFKYYFLRLAKIPFDEQALEDDFERFADFLSAAGREHFLYRDFQSRNIMVRDGEPWFIDYQGGRKGALQYDIASLLFDAKADLPFAVRDELLDHYLEAASRLAPVDRGEFLKRYPAFAYIRIMQAMGTYGLRGFYERKTQFLQSIPYAVANLEHLLRESPLEAELPALTQVWHRVIASSALRQFGGASLKLTVRVQSFSYKDGMPADDSGHGGGYVFDCRALPNPGKFARYSKLTGRDPEVIAFLEAQPPVEEFLDRAAALVAQNVENYRGRNFTDLMVAFGCTGGQHRSVYCAEKLARLLREKLAVEVELRHRELDKEQGPER